MDIQLEKRKVFKNVISPTSSEEQLSCLSWDGLSLETMLLL